MHRIIISNKTCKPVKQCLYTLYIGPDVVHCCQLSRAVFYFYLSENLNEGFKDLTTLSHSLLDNNEKYRGALLMCSLKYEDYDMNTRNVN